jgi:hypothetical protein
MRFLANESDLKFKVDAQDWESDRDSTILVLMLAEAVEVQT